MGLSLIYRWFWFFFQSSQKTIFNHRFCKLKKKTEIGRVMLSYNTCQSYIFPLGQTRDIFLFRRDVKAQISLWLHWNNVHTLNHFIMNVHISPSYMTFSFPPGMKLVLSYVSNAITVRCVYQIVYEYNFLCTVVLQYRHSPPPLPSPITN